MTLIQTLLCYSSRRGSMVKWSAFFGRTSRGLRIWIHAWGYVGTERKWRSKVDAISPDVGTPATNNACRQPPSVTTCVLSSLLCLFMGRHGKWVGGNTRKRAIKTCEGGQTHLFNPLPKGFSRFEPAVIKWGAVCWRRRRKGERGGEMKRAALLGTSSSSFLSSVAHGFMGP